MIDPKVQPLRVRISFGYNAAVYDGDPDDAFEIAGLEAGELEESLRNRIEDAVGVELRNFTLSIQPD